MFLLVLCGALIVGLAIAISNSVGEHESDQGSLSDEQHLTTKSTALARISGSVRRHVLDFTFVVGTSLQSSERFAINTRDLMNSHFVVMGASGCGKSRWIRSIVDQAVAQGAGVTVLDLAGDTAEDILAGWVRRIVDSGLSEAVERFHYFEPGNPQTSFRFDPFRFEPAKEIHPDFRENFYRSWLHATVDRIGMLVQLKQGQIDFEQNARLQRVLGNLLTAVGTAIDKTGRHLPLSDALVLLTVSHERHDEVYERVEPFLDPIIREDFRRLRSLKREEDRLREIESTINRLRSLLGPVLRAIFGTGNGEATVDFRTMILQRQIAFWNLRPTECFSHDQKRTFAQLVIHMILETALSIPRDQRVPHLLVIEEAGEVLNEEILWALGALRKTGLSIVLVVQDVSTMRREGRFDLAPKVLSQCNVVCFNQSWPEDTDILSRVLFTGNIDFAPLVHEQDRPDGYDWHKVEEHSTSQSEGQNWNVSNSETSTIAKGSQEGTTESTSRSRTSTNGTSLTAATGSSTSVGTSRSLNKGTHQSPIVRDESVVRRVDLNSKGQAVTNSKQTQTSNSQSEGSQSSSSEGESESVAKSVTNSLTVSEGVGRTVAEGGSTQRGSSTSVKHIPLARHRTERRLSGKLVRAVGDQLEEFRQAIATLPARRAFVKLQNHAEAFSIETLPMPDAFLSPVAQQRAIEWIKREVFAQHPYNFVPDFSPDAEERRLSEFLEPPIAEASIGLEQARSVGNPLA